MRSKKEIKKSFTKVEDYIIKDNYFNAAECEKLVRLCKLQKWAPHEWYSYQSDKATQGATDCKVTDAEINFKTTLEPIITKAIKKYQNAVTFNSKEKRFIYKMTPIRLNKYEKGRDMKEHFDHISSIFTGEDKGVPILSIIGFLNDDFEGGELYINGKSINPKRGDILIFPSNFMYPHEVKPVTKGERYSYVAWAF
jgi:predicted 2-oxoglutarate/Fe(II)-dependent dioxygenase YbiX